MKPPDNHTLYNPIDILGISTGRTRAIHGDDVIGVECSFGRVCRYTWIKTLENRYYGDDIMRGTK